MYNRHNGVYKITDPSIVEEVFDLVDPKSEFHMPLEGMFLIIEGKSVKIMDNDDGELVCERTYYSIDGAEKDCSKVINGIAKCN